MVLAGRRLDNDDASLSNVLNTEDTSTINYKPVIHVKISATINQTNQQQAPRQPQEPQQQQQQQDGYRNLYLAIKWALFVFIFQEGSTTRLVVLSVIALLVFLYVQLKTQKLLFHLVYIFLCLRAGTKSVFYVSTFV